MPRYAIASFAARTLCGIAIAATLSAAAFAHVNDSRTARPAAAMNLEKAVDPSHCRSSDQPEDWWPRSSPKEFRKRASQDEGQPLGVRQLLRSGLE